MFMFSLCLTKKPEKNYIIYKQTASLSCKSTNQGFHDAQSASGMSRRVSSSSMWFMAWSPEKTVGHGGHGHHRSSDSTNKRTQRSVVPGCGAVWPRHGPKSFLCRSSAFYMYIGFIWFYIGYVSNEFFSWLTWISVHFVRFHWQSQRLAQRSTRKHRKLSIVLFYPILVSSVCQQSFVVQKLCVSKPVCKLAHFEKMLAQSVQGQVGLDARGRRTLDWKTNVCLLTLTFA